MLHFAVKPVFEPRLIDISGFRFKIKDLVDPFDVIKICVDISDPQLALR